LVEIADIPERLDELGYLSSREDRIVQNSREILSPLRRNHLYRSLAAALQFFKKSQTHSRNVALIACISIARLSVALSPERNIDQYFHDEWTAERNLPGEAVYQILQSSDGYLWLRTSAGLVRFDGVRFVLMDEVIGREPVKAIATAADGNLLVRTTSRTILYKNGAFSDYFPASPLPDGETRSLFESQDHTVFIGSDNFIYSATRDGIHSLLDGTSWISAFLEDDTHTVWIGGTDSLYAYRDGRLSTPVATGADEGVFALAQDHRKTIWVGTTRGLYRLAGDRKTLEPFGQGSLRSGVNQIFEDHAKNLWIATRSSGLLRMTGGKITSFQATDGLTDNNVLALFEDREGSLWIGTANGLDRLRDTKLTSLTTKEGLPSNDASSAITTHDGAIYVLCSYGGLAKLMNGRVASTITRIPGLHSIHGGALFEDKKDRLWIGTAGGLTRIENGRITVFRSAPELAKRYISSIGEDDEGLILGTSQTALLRVKDGKTLPFTVRGRSTPLTGSGNYVFAIYRQPSGTIWLGTVKGLFKYLPGTIPVRQPQIDFSVTNISDDERGDLWLGGRTPGIVRFRLRDGQVTHYWKRDGLFNNYAFRVLPDNHGNLWIGTSNGIFRAQWKDLDDFAGKRIAHVPATEFGIKDGMKTSEANSAAIGSGGCKSADGKLWFTTVAGIVSVDPDRLPQNSLRPTIVVESVAADDLQFSPNRSIDIPPGKDKIEFHYTALSLRIPRRVQFKYQLEGYDKDWVDAGIRRVAYYNNLRPGSYRFHVIADNDDGLWNTEGASIAVALQPHYYQTLWFLYLSLLVLGCAVVAAFRFHTRGLRLRAQELARQVDERTKALQLEILERRRAEDAAVQAREDMRFQATHDSLTQFLNRGSILDLLKRELSRSVREQLPIALLMVDLDHFKDVNDKYGHLVGDEVLREAADRLLQSVRPYDLVGRYGGEEFLIVLSNCDAATAIERAEQLRHATAERPVRTLKGQISVTMSLGVLPIDPNSMPSFDDALHDVDQALYAAKRQGRNRCVTASCIR
jgi:diguanylate cyclase (GGDEF)-like protein